MGILVEDSYKYTLVASEFYEPLERHDADESDYRDLVVPILPDAWRIARHGIWFHCAPPDAELPPQGWKIHLSATPANSAAVLTSASRLLVTAGIPYKFAVDKKMLLLLNNKRWPRGGAGKFITVYPADVDECRRLLDRLRETMTGYNGPYILSDRRYRDSRIVHYRYGGILPTRMLDVGGGRVPVIRTASGEVARDERTPFFQLPEGISDPFVDEPEPDDPDGEPTLGDGRYRVLSVLAFSNSGGVYRARDRETGEDVVIKEARAYTNVSPRGTDAVWLLKKEHRLHTLLDGTGVAPRPIDFFQDWEHFYLVEEFVDGINLRGYTARNALGLRTRPSPADAEAFWTRYRSVYARVAEALQALHGRNIVFGDISHYNVLVSDDGEDVTFIDFEGAYERGVDVPTHLFTPGFAPAGVRDEGIAHPEDDCYGLGGLMLAGLIPINDLHAINPKAHEPFLRAWTRDLGLPPEIARTIRGLLRPERSERISLADVVDTLRRDRPVRAPSVGTHEADVEDGAALLARTVRYLRSVADPDREDRLFPAAPAIFKTNPLSVAHGACGVAYALNEITGGVPADILDWILARDVSAEAYPPGLYVGLSGIAWALLELGFRDRAEEILRMTDGHPLLRESPDLFDGVAGWGMTQLRFFLATGDECYLAQARSAGEHLLNTREDRDGECWWPVQGNEHCGLGHGASGVSLFLLYLHLVDGGSRWLDVGRRGLDYVLARAVRNVDDGLTWRVREGHPTHTPYWRWGSAGIGMVLLRYHRILADDAYRAALHGILIDTDRKYSIFPGRFIGLSGVGEFFLDLAAFGCHDEREAMDAARKLLSGVLLFKVEREDGVAFPGETRSRISCDFGTGGAGIALFIHRYLERGRPAFMLDELLWDRVERDEPAPEREPAAAVLT